jgi:uncharacterized protein YbjT (DUF2867 family)
MTVLITGADGNVGRIVVERLLAAGEPVRALTRDPRKAFPPGVEVVAGDLADPPTLRGAFDGVERLYLFPVPATARAVAGLARRSGVRRVVVLSSGAVTGGHDTDFHLPVERAVEESGVEWTHVRPGEFALNKLWLWGPSIRAERVVRDPFPEAAWFPTHERDIADVAVAALVGEGHAGAAYDVSGPEMIGNRAQVRAIAAALGEPIRHERVTRERAREEYLRQGGFAAANAAFLLGFEDYSGAPAAEADGGAPPEETGGGAPPALPTCEPVTGRPGRTFARWALDHAADFR